MNRIWVLLMYMVAAGIAPAFAQTVDHYEVGTIEVFDLGTLGGKSSYGYGINDFGDVVGTADGADGKSRAFIYTDGAMVSLHGSSPAFDRAWAFDINNAREVVGHVILSQSNRVAFHYYPGIWLTPISADASFPMGHTWYAAAYAINENGRIVGNATRIKPPGETAPVDPTYKACYDQLPVRWADATTLPWPLFCISDPDSDHLSGSVSANDVNDSDSIVGHDAKTSLYSMFLYKNGVRYLVPAPAGLPTTLSPGVNANGQAHGVNNKNHVVGEYTYRDPDGSIHSRAYLWDGVSSNSVSLGVLANGKDSRAYKLNELDMVVGYTNWKAGAGETVNSAFLWHADFGLVQLPPLDYQMHFPGAVPRNCGAMAINELKFGQVQITGGCDVGGRSHAVRWDVKIKTIYNH